MTKENFEVLLSDLYDIYNPGKKTDISNILEKYNGQEYEAVYQLLFKYNYPDCVGVEIGSLHGRSSYAISIAINKGKLYCIDLWDGRASSDDSLDDEFISKNKLPTKGSFCNKEIFLQNVADRPNIIPIYFIWILF